MANLGCGLLVVVGRSATSLGFILWVPRLIARVHVSVTNVLDSQRWLLFLFRICTIQGRFQNPVGVSSDVSVQCRLPRRLLLVDSCLYRSLVHIHAESPFFGGVVEFALFRGL